MDANEDCRPQTPAGNHLGKEGAGQMLGNDLAPFWVAAIAAVIGAVATMAVTKLDRFTLWVQKKRREELDSLLLNAIDRKLDERHAMLVGLGEKVDEYGRALELHTSQEADLVTQVVSQALEPVMERLGDIETRLTAAKL